MSAVVTAGAHRLDCHRCCGYGLSDKRGLGFRSPSERILGARAISDYLQSSKENYVHSALEFETQTFKPDWLAFQGVSPELTNA